MMDVFCVVCMGGDGVVIVVCGGDYGFDFF